MTVLINTNVILDFLLTREPFYEAALKIVEKCASGELKGYIAFHSIPNLWYILRKVPEKKRREWLADMCTFLEVTGASHEAVVRAITMTAFRDFEDCLQDRCAEQVRADYIITRNLEDFKESDVPAILPADFLKKAYL